MDKTSNIKERILQLSELKSVSKEIFFKNLGLTYGNFKGKSKETPINSNALVDILTKYPDVNPTWLLTGDGEVFKSAEVERVASDLLRSTNGFDLESLQKESNFKQFVDTYERVKSKIFAENEDSTPKPQKTSLSHIQTVDSSEFYQLGDDRYMVICPLVDGHDRAPYSTKLNDPDYINDLPHHAVVFDRLRLGVYRSFAFIDDQPNLMTTTFAENANLGCIVTGRRVEKKLWKSEAYLSTLGGVVVVKPTMTIFAADKEIQKHKSTSIASELGLEDALELFEVESISHYKK